MKIAIILFFILALLTTCYKEAQYTKAITENIYKFSSDSTSILADSLSTTKLSVRIPGNAADTFSYVTFKTTNGSFLENNLKIITALAKETLDKKERVAEAILRSSLTEGSAIVSVELFNVRLNQTIELRKSLPETIILTPSSFSIKPANDVSGEINIEVMLSKKKGFPSIGNIVEIKAYDSIFQKELGSFRVYNNISNSLGKTNFTYVLGDSVLNNLSRAYTGQVYIVGSVSVGSNQNQSDTIKLISSR